jgi:hypothetical protein
MTLWQSMQKQETGLSRDQLFAIETMLNQKMREISVQLLKDEQHMPPVLRMEKLNKYTFNTPNDEVPEPNTEV